MENPNIEVVYHRLFEMEIVNVDRFRNFRYCTVATGEWRMKQ